MADVGTFKEALSSTTASATPSMTLLSAAATTSAANLASEATASASSVVSASGAGGTGGLWSSIANTASNLTNTAHSWASSAWQSGKDTALSACTSIKGHASSAWSYAHDNPGVAVLASVGTVGVIGGSAWLWPRRRQHLRAQQVTEDDELNNALSHCLSKYTEFCNTRAGLYQKPERVKRVREALSKAQTDDEVEVIRTAVESIVDKEVAEKIRRACEESAERRWSHADTPMTDLEILQFAVLCSVREPDWLGMGPKGSMWGEEGPVHGLLEEARSRPDLLCAWREAVASVGTAR